MTFDPNKPVQTRDGRKARIICDDADKLGTPIIALVKFQNDDEYLGRFAASGRRDDGGEEGPGDLVNIPEKRWVILLKDGTWIERNRPGQLIPWNGSEAPLPIACLEFTEGDGL